MKGQNKVKRGDYFKGVADYCLTNEKCKIIGGNMSGYDAATLAAEFEISRKLRPDIAKPVWHNSLRLPKGEVISAEKFAEIGDAYMKKMGFTDQHQRVYFLEDHPDGQHIHIEASRIGLDGKLYLGKNENLESTKQIAILEKEFNLTITKGRDEMNPTRRPDVSLPKKNEIEKAIRTNELPVRMRLQEAVISASLGKPTTAAFFERLDLQGVTPIPSVQSTGRVAGMSYSLDGISMKGSDLGARYGWGKFSTKEINYEQSRDHEIVAERAAIAAESNFGDAGPGIGNDRGAELQNRGNGKNFERVDAGNAAPARSGIEHRDNEFGVRIDRENARISGVERATERQNHDGLTDVYEGGNRENERGGDQSNQALELVSRNVRLNVDGVSAGGESNRVDQNAEISNSNGYRRHDDFDDSVHVAVSDTRAATSFDLETSATDRAIVQPATAKTAPYAVADKVTATRVQAWQRQHSALNAPEYRVTFVSRREEKGMYTHVQMPDGRQKKKDGDELFWTAKQIEDKIKSGDFSRKNDRGYDVYLTPIDPEYHHILIDDVKNPEHRAYLIKEHSPQIVQRTSVKNGVDNYQLVLRVSKMATDPDVVNRIGNNISRHFNSRYGDPSVTNGDQQFRLSGFRNMKPDRGGVATELDWGKCKVGIAKNMDAIEDQAYRGAAKEIDVEQNQQAVTRRMGMSMEYKNSSNREQIAFGNALEKHYAIMNSKGDVDASQIDIRACREVIREGMAPEIAAGLLREVSDRKKKPDDYCARTIDAAVKDVEAERSAHEREIQRQQQIKHKPPGDDGIGGGPGR